ncbi:MAG: tetratricopeptide repeat protein [Thermodesulfobacteriota bacterium]|nr:tetratricopeptide repeat protein [Thermodesulfobacteriota bacterium]
MKIPRSLMVLKPLVRLVLCWCVPLVLCCCATNTARLEEQAKASRQLGEGYLAEGNLTAALSQFLGAEKIYDKDPLLHYDLGLAYFGKDEFDLAISHFKKAVALKPDYSEAFNAMGRVYGQLKQWDTAISCFHQALSNLLYTTPHVALNNLGEAYRGKGDYERAIDFYRQALRKDPRFPNAHRGLGLTYMDMGDDVKALPSLEKALHYAPRSPLTYFDLARVYVRLSETKKAISAFENVVTLAPDTPLADRALAEIRKLRQ